MAISLAHSCDVCKRLAIDFSNLKDFILKSGNEALEYSHVTQVKPSDMRRCSLLKSLLPQGKEGGWVDVRLSIGFDGYDADLRDLKFSMIGLTTDRDKLSEGQPHPVWESYCAGAPKAITPTLRRSVYVTQVDDAAGEHTWLHIPYPEPGSDEGLHIARQCLSDCQHRHDSCHPPGGLEPPKRLVLIAFQDDDLHLSLIEVHERVDYAALSYCWGGDQPFKLTAVTLADCLRSIDRTALPATLQDAITVTSAIGLSHLWADSLCIVQDDIEEKSFEINKMADIYTGATVTISAAVGMASTSGFLHREWRPLVARLPFRSRDGTRGHVYLQRAHLPTEPEPIELRAWTFQEHLLSSRVLFYGSQQLTWFCKGYRYNPNERQTLLFTQAAPHDSAHESTHCCLVLDATNEARKPPLNWPNLVEAYCKRSLTDPNDKLPAFSAIAKTFAAMYGSTYLAGLWQIHFLDQLLWHSFWADGVCTRPQAYRAPSWSWAAIDGPVIMQNMGQYTKAEGSVTMFEVVDCKVGLLHESVLYGRVSSGYLDGRGPLARVTLRLDYDRNGWGEVSVSPVSEDTIWPMGRRKKLQNEWTWDAVESSFQANTLVDVYLLEVIRVPYGGFWDTHGLILQQLEPAGVFRRVGYFELRRDFDAYFGDNGGASNVRSQPEPDLGDDGHWLFPPDVMLSDAFEIRQVRIV